MFFHCPLNHVRLIFKKYIFNKAVKLFNVLIHDYQKIKFLRGYLCKYTLKGFKGTTSINIPKPKHII